MSLATIYVFNMNDVKAVILPTKSMQKIVTAIATKVTHLLMSSSEIDDAKSTEPTTHNEKLFSDLVSSSESTLLALKDLVKVTGHTVAAEYPNDENIVEEVDAAAQNLLVCGENLLLCCQVLASTGSFSDPSSTHHDLSSSVSKCFESLVILLLCVDNAEVRLLVNLSNIALERLILLFESNTLEKLVEHFNSLAIAVYNFHTRAIQRCDDLLSSTSHNNMIKGLTTLKHSMPMLTTAFSLAIKYPKNEEAASSKIFASQQVEKTIKDIVAIIKARSDEVDFEGKTKIGLFASHIQSVDNALHPQNRYDLVPLELETVVQALVQRIMSLSVFVTKNAPQFSKRSTYLVKECRKLTELVCVVVRMVPSKASTSQQKSSSLLANVEDTSEYGSVCRVVRGKLKGLSKYTHSLVISLLSHFLTLTTEPFFELKRVHDSTQHNRNPKSLLKLKSFIGSFETHFKDILQVTSFIGMCCDDPTVYEELEACITNFNDLSNQIVERCSAYATQSENEFDHSENEADFAQLAKDWPSFLNALLHCCMLSMDLSQLTSGIESDIVSEFEKCHEDIVNLDDVSLSQHVISATGKAKLLAMVGNGVIAASTDPVYRNGVLSHVKQLNDAIAHVIASSNLLIEDTARLGAQESFLAAASSLKAKVGDVRVALMSKSNHPQLTSEERKGLRDFSDPHKISGMIKQMHALNQKLAHLGFEPKVSPIQFSSAHSRETSFTEDIDQLLGTSGPRVNVDNVQEEMGDENLVSSQPGTHPLIDQLLEVCSKSNRVHEDMENSLAAIKKMTYTLNDIVDDSESIFTSSPQRVANALTRPVFVNSQKDDAESSCISEVVSIWRKNLNESYSLMEGCVEEEDNFEMEMFKSLCETWSKSCRILIGCSAKVLQIFSVCVRKYISVPEMHHGSPDENPSSSSSEEDYGSSPEIQFMVEKSYGGLLMLGRINETLNVLLSDVIILYKREIDNNYNKDRSSPVNARLDALLNRSRKLSSDLTIARKDLRQKAQLMDDGILLEKADVSWLHVHSLVCASKLHALSSIVETVMQMVIGVRRLPFPVDYFLNGNSKSFQLMREYKEKIVSLAKSTVDKTNRALAKHNLEMEEVSKVHKIRNRIEISSQSIEKIMEFMLGQQFSDALLSHHGFLICHVFFLHQRVSLEIARILLVIKALAFLSASDADQENRAPPQTLFLTVKGDKNIDTEGQFPEANGGNKAVPFSERLAELTQQRKEREKDLFYLLSDVDNLPAETKKAQVSLPAPKDSEC